jgi:hypothetical protein
VDLFPKGLKNQLGGGRVAKDGVDTFTQSSSAAAIFM